MHCVRRAASRAAWTAGSSSAIRTAMIAMTTSSSIRVNPRRFMFKDSSKDVVDLGGDTDHETIPVSSLGRTRPNRIEKEQDSANRRRTGAVIQDRPRQSPARLVEGPDRRT